MQKYTVYETIQKISTLFHFIQFIFINFIKHSETHLIINTSSGKLDFFSFVVRLFLMDRWKEGTKIPDQFMS